MGVEGLLRARLRLEYKVVLLVRGLELVAAGVELIVRARTVTGRSAHDAKEHQVDEPDLQLLHLPHALIEPSGTGGALAADLDRGRSVQLPRKRGLKLHYAGHLDDRYGTCG